MSYVSALDIGRHRPRPAALSILDRYARLLFFCLIGYATAARGFAYVGVAPIFIGELLLVSGVAVIVLSGTALVMLSNVTTILIGLLIGLVAARAAGQVGAYGIEALRDSVIVVYGVFAFVVLALILERPKRLEEAMRGFLFLAKIVIPASPFLYLASKSGQGIVPTWPNEVQMIDLRPGEMAVHFTGACALALFGYRRPSWLWIAFALICFIMVAAQSRGGTLAIVIPLFALIMIRGKFAALARVGTVIFLVLALAYVADIQVKLPGGVQGGQRALSVRQLADNITSVFEPSQAAALDGTKEFRLTWWRKIIGYTFGGEYFWTGRGYGMNLSEVDGFVVGRELGGPPLRSPHNGFMTILARSGVPGLTLFLAVLLTWFWQLGRAMIDARALGQEGWQNTFLFVMAYVSAIIIDASFDVALEGPILGIWFWSLIGFGLGAHMVFRAQWRRSV